jgi:hypothetical protein
MTALRELARSKQQGQLGDRAMVRVRAVPAVLHRVEWEYDGYQTNWNPDGINASETSEEPVRRLRVKFFRSRGAAYNWMALRLIFAKRNKLATRIGSNGYPDGCRLCDIEAARPYCGAPDEAPTAACRYHDHGGEHFVLLRSRLARWLMWRDSLGTERK